MFGKKKERPVPREDGLTDYDVYIMGKQERILTIIFAAIVLFAVGYVFYHNIILSMLFALLSFTKKHSASRRHGRERLCFCVYMNICLTICLPEAHVLW